MVEYKLVKYCRACKTRFTVDKGQSRVIYCKPCQRKIKKEQ